MTKGKVFTLKAISNKWLEEFSLKVHAYRQTITDRAPKVPVDPDKIIKITSSEDKYQAMVKVAKKYALKMGHSKNTDFFAAATKQLVNNVLKREFGDALAQSKQFPKMQNAITSAMLTTPKYRKALEGLFDILDKSQNIEEKPDAPPINC